MDRAEYLLSPTNQSEKSTDLITVILTTSRRLNFSFDTLLLPSTALIDGAEHPFPRGKVL